MCDPFSFIGAGTDNLGGMAQSAAIKGRGQAEAMQFQAMQFMTTANSRYEENAVRREFEEAASMNVASIAVSNLSARSFESIEQGNRKELKRATTTIERNAQSRISDLEFKKQMSLISARFESKAAMMNGFMSAASKLVDAERSYQNSKIMDKSTGKAETRFNFFKRAVKRY